MKGDETLKRIAKSFIQIIKFNPYHDRLGRFSTSGNSASFTYSPGKSKAHDNAIAREKERMLKASKIISSSQKKVSSILQDNGVSTGKKEAAKEISDYFQKTALKNGIQWDAECQKVVAKRESIDEMKKIARDIMSKQEYEDDTTSAEYHELRDTIKRTPIRIDRQDTMDIADWNDYRKSNFGNMTISRNGISVDILYQELSSLYPHYFDSQRDTHPADQIKRINETLSHLKPKKYRLNGAYLDEAAENLGLSMLRGYVKSVAMAA